MSKGQKGGPRKYTEGVYKTFYFSKEALDKAQAKCRRLGIPLSALVGELLLKWAESDVDVETQYSTLKRKYYRLVVESRRLSKMLRDMGGAEELSDLAQGLGLDMKTLDNLGEVIPKLEKAYTGMPEKLNLFIDLLELARQRIEVGGQLSEIRRRKYGILSIEEVGNVEAIPPAHTVSGVESVS